MRHLSSDLLNRLSQAILKIHAPALPYALPALYFEAVQTLVPSDTLSYNEFGENHFCGITEPLIDVELNQRFAALSSEHPSIAHFTQTNEAGAVKISDFFTLRSWKKKALYNEFFRELNLDYQLAFLSRVGSIQIGFAANRHSRDFSENDRALLSLLQPHFNQAYLSARALERTQRAGDALGGGTVALSREGTILYASPKAREAMALFFNHSTASHLPDELRRWALSALQKWVPGRLSSALLHPLQSQNEAGTLYVRLAPDFRMEEHLLLFEVQPHTTTAPCFTEYGLSKRESEVLGWLAQGKTNPEIALILQISRKTVAHHVEHILSKLGVETRGSAAYWALETLRLPPGDRIVA